ncbi:hypothetical protein BKH20_00770 [Actinomyces oris]|uniref:ROK family protein n=1 Tax=Actinomyces oris TaxID=544580 RepID=A0A1Q8WY11_9ACTO|nr:ROK family protein [Actinomyces oris]OLO72968.1 hypothetical protein BKH20_00770 [Actinomyces oris]
MSPAGRTTAEIIAEALECYEQLTHWLGVGLADMCALLDPEVIVIAGGLAEGGQEAGLVGAADLARQP